MASTASSATAGHPPTGTRRDFLYIATAMVGAVGAAAILVPLVDQMNPDASTLAAGGPVDLDVSKISEGQQVVIRWRQRPIFVFRRSKEMLQAMQSSQMISQLSDPNSEQLQQPPYAATWHRSIKPELGVLVGICTHLGCIVAHNESGGFACPCHGSRYNEQGEVTRGPAPSALSWLELSLSPDGQLQVNAESQVTRGTKFQV